MTQDPFETYDGTYVVGALSSADRELFEAHLESCDACMHRVAALWNMSDLLGLAPAEAFYDAAAPTANGYQALMSTLTTLPPAATSGPDRDDPAFPDDMLPRLLDRISHHHRRRRLSRVVVGVAAACILALAGVIAVTSINHSARPQAGAVPTVSVTNAALAAQLSVTSHDSWDQVNLTFTYKSQTFISGNYTAIAKDKAGRSEVVGSWPPIPGQTAVIHTPTTFHTGKIATVSIVDAKGSILAVLAI